MALQIDRINIVVKGNVPKKFPNGTHTVLTFGPGQLPELEEGIAQAKKLIADGVLFAADDEEDGPKTSGQTAPTGGKAVETNG